MEPLSLVDHQIDAWLKEKN